MMGRDSEIHAEYIIPGTIIPIDLLDSITGEIWEIKPLEDRTQAREDVKIRVAAMNIARGSLHGMTPIATQYNWDYSPLIWKVDRQFPAETFIGIDNSGWVAFYAGQVEPGVILWWKKFLVKPVVVTLPLLLPNSVTWNQRKQKNILQPNYSPASAYELLPFVNQDAIRDYICSGITISSIPALFWWLGKIASPACGPLSPACAIIF